MLDWDADSAAGLSPYEQDAATNLGGSQCLTDAVAALSKSRAALETDWQAFSPPHSAFDLAVFLDRTADDPFIPYTLADQDKADLRPHFSGEDEATWVDEVIVVGRRRSESGGWSGGGYDTGWYDWDGYDTNENAYQQDPPPPQRPADWSECKDRKIDDLAKEAANRILARSDEDVKEYGFLIWEDNQGTIRLSDIIEGNNGQLTGLTHAFLSSQGIDASQVVGLVHSHPTRIELSRPDGTTYWVDATPESHFEMPSAGDWLWIDGVFSEGNPNSEMLRQYIVFDGSMYEYDLYENPNTGNAQTRRDSSQQATNADGECGA